MNTYIALFRGVNVGGHHSLPMNGLKEILVSLGCEAVRTYIQSGNAVFRSAEADVDRLSATVSAAIFNRYGFEPMVLLIKQSEFEAAIEHNPFPTDKGNRLHFFFLHEEPGQPDLQGLKELKTDTESFLLNGVVFYLYAPDGIGRSKLAAKAGRCLGVASTARNWNTVAKLREMIQDGS